MSDKPRPWPNLARDARDRAAEAAQEAINALTPLITEDRTFTETERFRREARALAKLQHIARLLESVGASTRPSS